jgi:hypothetical protein
MDIIESIIDRRAFGLASDLAEARSHRRAGRRHDAPGAGGNAAEVLEEVRRRLAVGPELAEKGGDSDAFKRACVLFGIAEYLYGDEPAEPPTPTSNGNGRGEPRNVPRDRISFPDARAFYGWLKDHGHLGLAEEIGNREDLPVRIIHWSPEAIDAATLEILERTGHAR